LADRGCHLNGGEGVTIRKTGHGTNWVMGICFESVMLPCTCKILKRVHAGAL